MGADEAFASQDGEALDGAGGDTGPRFVFGLGEASRERGGADVEDEAGAPERMSEVLGDKARSY